jgi:hypothetical protein
MKTRTLFRALAVGSLLFRLTAAQAATITVYSNGDVGGTCPGATCTLRQAILAAASGDTINFAAGITATISLIQGELLIGKTLTIDGPGANVLTVRGNLNYSVFHIGSGNFAITLSGLTITQGCCSGGVFNEGSSTLSITGCTITGNHDCGIYNYSTGTVNITNSTLSGNSANLGGGIRNGSTGTVNLTNSTISDNSAGSAGGGIANFGTLTITNGTISANSAGGDGGGIYNNSGNTVNGKNSIIAKNTSSTSFGPDFNGILTSQGYNLIGNTSGMTITGTTTGNQLNVDPLLGPLQNNGGPTLTQALLLGSTAIDAGNDATAPPTDQRGFSRSGVSDIGAFEFNGIAPPPPTPTPTPTPTPAPTTQAINLSTRMLVESAGRVGIGGFIITGTAPKNVLLRAIGPSLPVTGALADPMMELHGPAGFTTIINDNWRDDPGQEAAIIATGIPPTNNLESAILVTLNPGAYTAIIIGRNGTSGVGLVEVYDLSQAVLAKLANISTRAFVSTGNNIVIAGFILGGNNGNDRIVVRGIGPSLTAAGVPYPLANPTLELRDHNGTLLIANNDWQDDPAQAALITAAGLAPTNPLESAIAATLLPGQYTALLSGVNNGTGVGLVEVYDLGAP